MRPNRIFQALLLIAVVSAPGLLSLRADEVARTEALKIAESYIGHGWHASATNVMHGRDRRGVEVHTPDQDGGRGFPRQHCWRVDSENVGVAYKWGGVDTPASFDVGIKAGKAAGDVYTREKRRLDDKAISDAAVGIDCSGFICRCWKTSSRYSTISLARICQKLPAATVLKPADIMNTTHGHVLLFVKWLDPEKKRALFYESAPFSKTLASERDISEMIAAGYIPMRYKQMGD